MGGGVECGRGCFNFFFSSLAKPNKRVAIVALVTKQLKEGVKEVK